MLYWNIRNRVDGPLGIHVGHNGLVRLSIDPNMEYIHHPDGKSSIDRIEIYKLGLHKTSISNSMTKYRSIIHKQHNEYNNVFSVDAHKLVESIGIHLFT